MRSYSAIVLTALIAVQLLAQPLADQQSDDTAPAADFDAIVATAFAETAAGYSVDEVLIDDQRRAKFLAAVAKRQADAREVDAAEVDCNLTLLRLRKTGKLNVTATQRGRRADPAIRPAAEIAARVVCDRSGQTTDTILADPELRMQLLTESRRIVAEAQSYDVFKQVLSLRKIRKLKPELLLRVVEWQREISVFPIEKIEADLALIPELPGVYLFREPAGYLYIGEASNLKRRLAQHLSPTAPKTLKHGTVGQETLAGFLAEQGHQGLSVEIHAFGKSSPGSKLRNRRAYESELIRSRQPKLNIRP